MFVSAYHLARISLTLYSTINERIMNATDTKSLPGAFIEEGFAKIQQTLDYGENLSDDETAQATSITTIADETSATFFKPLAVLLRQMDGMTDAAFVSRGKDTLHPVGSVKCRCTAVYSFVLFGVSFWTRFKNVRDRMKER